jgi:hypothetical protein
MNKKYFFIALVFILSAVLQYYMEIEVGVDFIEVLLTMFSIFFGFYITSFAVFATSKYLNKLYQIDDERNNSMTLLDVLLKEFSFATNLLLASIVYLILFYIMVLNNQFGMSYLLWGVIFLDIFYIFKTIKLFILVTRKSAIE